MCADEPRINWFPWGTKATLILKLERTQLLHSPLTHKCNSFSTEINLGRNHEENSCISLHTIRSSFLPTILRICATLVLSRHFYSRNLGNSVEARDRTHAVRGKLINFPFFVILWLWRRRNHIVCRRMQGKLIDVVHDRGLLLNFNQKISLCKYRFR